VRVKNDKLIWLTDAIDALIDEQAHNPDFTFEEYELQSIFKALHAIPAQPQTAELRRVHRDLVRAALHHLANPSPATENRLRYVLREAGAK
jgi:hypothetical protein